MVLAALAWADHRSWFYYQGGDWRRYHGRSFTVVDVLDGDTIEIDVADGQFATTRIRLWGVDAPESFVAETSRPAQPPPPPLSPVNVASVETFGFNSSHTVCEGISVGFWPTFYCPTVRC